MGTIRFQIRKDKINTDGLCPIELIYSANSVRRYYGTGQTIPEVNWDIETQLALFLDKKGIKLKDPKAKPPFATEEETQACNRELMKLKTAVEKIEALFNLEGKPYTSEMVVDRLKSDVRPAALVKPNEILLHDFIDTFCNSRESSVDIKTGKGYKALKRHINDFQIFKKKRVTLSNIDYTFFEDFRTFLINPYKKRKALENSTVIKRLSNIKTLLTYAEIKELATISVTVRRFKNSKTKEKPVIALTQKEFVKLFNLNLTAKPKLARVRDVLCFSCSTGLRYSDIEQLKWNHIKKDEIVFTPMKTDAALIVPLNQYSTAILKRYEENERPLPVISNQKSNKYIKELCKLAEINEPIETVKFFGGKRVSAIREKWQLMSMHKGRKTFITLSLEKGMSLSDTMATAGIRDFKTLKRYSKTHEDSKKSAMKKAWK